MSDWMRDMFKPMPPKIAPVEDRISPFLLRNIWRPVIQSSPIVIASPMIDDGFQIVTSLYMTERRQFRFPRSKRKRVRKKFTGNWRNWKDLPSPKILRNGKVLYMHPMIAERLKRKLKNASTEPS